MWRIWVVLTMLFVLTACQQEQADYELPRDTGQSVEVVQEATPTPIVIRMTATPKPSLPTISGALDVSVMPEGHHPQRPFAIHFTQPIDLSSVNGEGSIHIDPTIDGEMAWSDGYRTATFTPKTEFASGETYTIRLHPNLLGRSGLDVDEQTWEIRMLAHPTILTYDEYSTHLHQPEFVLNFDSNMDFFSVASAISIEPEVPIEVLQEGGQIVVRPEALSFGETYTFLVEPTAMSVSGLPLAETYTWQYELKEVVQRFRKPTRTDPSLDLIFNYKIDKESFAYSVEPPIPFELVWRSDTQVLLRPTDASPGDQEYTLTIADGLKTTDGIPLPPVESMTFDMPDMVTLGMSTTGTHSLRTPLVLNFRATMNTTLTERAISIDPPVAGTWVWTNDNQSAQFRPDDVFWQAGTDYTVTMAETAVSASNRPILSTPFQFSFSTQADPAPIARFDSSDNDVAWQTIPTGEPLPLHYGMQGYIAEADFYLQPLRVDTWLTNDNIQPVGTTQTWHDSIDSGRLVFSTTIPALSTGLYRLTIAGSQPNEDNMILFAADHALTLNETVQGDMVWLTDWQNNPVASATIEVWANGALIATGLTDEQGLYQTNVPADGKLVAKQDEVVTAVLVHNRDWHSQWSITPSRPSAYAQTSRPIYQLGDDVSVYAVARTAQGDPLPHGTPITAQLYWFDRELYGHSTKVAEWQMTTNHFGTVTGRWLSDLTANTGNYEVRIVYDNKAIAQTSFRLLASYDAEQQITLQASQPHYVMNAENPMVTGQWLGPNGQPVANQVLKWQHYSYQWNGEFKTHEWYSSQRGGVNVKTDDNGRFTIPTEALEELVAVHGYSSNTEVGIRVWAPATPDVEAFVNFTISKASAKLSQLTVATSLPAFTPVPVSVQLTHYDGTPLANQTVVFSVYDDQANVTLTQVSATTDANGIAQGMMTVNSTGYYDVRATASYLGQQVNTAIGSLVFFDSQTNDGRLAIYFDKPMYDMGETARLVVSVPEDTTALLTTLQANETKTELITLQAPQTIIELPVTQLDKQWVTLQAWQPVLLTDDNPYSRLSYNPYRLVTLQEEVMINPAHDDLTLTATWDKETYEAGETAVLTLRATNRQGEPVSAELMVSLFDAIWAQYPQLTSSHHLQELSLIELGVYHNMAWQRHIGEYWGHGCGGGGYWMELSPFGSLMGQAHTVWLPNLVTDANGEVTISVPLPTAGTWQLEVHAITADTQIGTLSTTIITNP